MELSERKFKKIGRGKWVDGEEGAETKTLCQTVKKIHNVTHVVKPML